MTNNNSVSTGLILLAPTVYLRTKHSKCDHILQVLVACKSQIIPAAARDHVPEYVIRRVREMLNDNLQHEVCIEIGPYGPVKNYRNGEVANCKDHFIL